MAQNITRSSSPSICDYFKHLTQTTDNDDPCPHSTYIMKFLLLCVAVAAASPVRSTEEASYDLLQGVSWACGGKALLGILGIEHN